MSAAPRALRIAKEGKQLVIDYGSFVATLPAHALRRASPALRGSDRPVSDKVYIVRADPVGQYAVRFLFSDGHNAGLYTWAVLAALAQKYKDHS